MEKIILTESIQLNKMPTAPGSSGVVIVEQDLTGGHLITLAAGNVGVTDISLKPGGITRLDWSRDDVNTYWASTKITAEDLIKAPSIISDLVSELVDTKGVKIAWTAPQGFLGDSFVATDIYYVVVSATAFDVDYALAGIRIPITPAMPGVRQSYVVSGLNPGQRYYVAVYSEKIAFGRTQRSKVSNIVSFITQALDGNVAVPKRIPLNGEKIYETLLHIMFKDGERFTNFPSFKRLADQDYLISNNGKPEGLPTLDRVAAYQSYGSYDVTWYNVNLRIFFDLEGIFDLDYIYMLVQNNNRFTIYGSSDAVNLFPLYDRANTPIETSNTTWTKIPLNEINKKGVRYLVLQVYYGDMVINGFAPYGTRVNTQDIKGVKYKQVERLRPVNSKIGTNAFFAELDPNYMGDLSSMTRFYNNFDWVLREDFHPQGSAVGKTPDDIQMSFINSHMWNYQEKILEALESGQKILFTLTNSPICLRDANATGNLNGAKPLDPGLNIRDMSKTTDPQSYKFMARFCALVAGKLGSNTAAPLEYMSAWDSGETTVGVGLGYVEYFEFGNEVDRNWEGVDAFRAPQELAAELSAYYDGHKNTMGPFMGLKAGDPNAKLLTPGLIGVNISYMWEMMRWWDLHRGIGDYPIDVINFHHYNQYTDAPDTPVYSTVPAYGLPPEFGDQIRQTSGMVGFKSTEAQRMEVWCTEIGYGEQNGGVTSPRDATKELRGIHKGVWLVRTQLICIYVGLDVTCQFWYAGDTVNVDDLNPNVITREAFYTCGYMDGIANFADRHRKPLIAYWYMNAFRNDMLGYTYSHTVVKAGVAQISEIDIVQTLNPSLWVMAFTHTDGRKCLVAWMGTDQWVQDNITFRVPNSSSTVKSLNYVGQHIRKTENGLEVNTTPTITGSGKTISLLITEVPTIIETTVVGTPKLIAPEKVIAKAISATAIKIVWRDKNYGQNKTRVFMSLYQDRDFVQVAEVYEDAAEITIDGLNSETPYFFKIAFVDGTMQSDLIENISAVTFVTINPPTNLRQVEGTASTITLAFDYPLADEVKTDNFLLYRSPDLNGQYVLVKSVTRSERTVRDAGLVADTQYFYKIRTEKEAVVSNFSFVVATTTAPPSFDPPIVGRVNLKATGAHMEVYFDKEMKNEATAIYAFTVIETFADGSYLVHKVSSINISPEDKTIVNLVLDVPAFKNSNVVLSYDATIGQLKSVYDAMLASFYGVQSENNTSVQYEAVKNYKDNNRVIISRNNLKAEIQGANIKAIPFLKAGTNGVVRMSVSAENTMTMALGSTITYLHPNYFEFYIVKENGRLETKVYSNYRYDQMVFNFGLIEVKALNNVISMNISTDNGLTWSTVRTGAQPNNDLTLFFFGNDAAVKAVNVITYGYEEEGITPEPGQKDYWDDSDNWNDLLNWKE